MFARFLYYHPRYVTLIILCAFAIGISSFKNIPRQEDPTLPNFAATITTFYPGATPDRVEALVTRPLEDQLLEIAEVDKIKSTSSTNVSFINVILLNTLPQEDRERVWSEIRDAISDAKGHFPAGVGEPVFDSDRLTSFTAIVALSSAGEQDMPVSILSRLGREFADQARNLPNTQLVEIFGEPQEEIRVEIDESALASRGLSVRQVSAALRGADAKVAAGRAITSRSDLLIEVSGDFTSMERIRQVIITTAADGSATRVADIARVYKGAVSPPRSVTLSQGRRSILVGAVMEPGSQVDLWSDDFNALIDDFRLEAPAGLQIELTFDQKPYAVQRLVDVGKNLGVGILLVILVLLFTLGWRAAVVVAIILPICGFISLTILERMDMALHQMTVSGLIVALGLLVDGSIVMTDEVRKRLLRGVNPVDAIRGSVDRLRVPLISSALTTILAFMPMAVMPGPGGEFVGAIAKAVITMLTVSTVLALVVTPVLASWLLPRNAESSRHWYVGGIGSGRGGRLLIAALDWSLIHPLASISLALALPIAGFLAFPTLTAQFFPGTDRDQLHVQVKLPNGRSINDTLALVERIDAKLRSDELVRRVDWTVGESAPAFYYNMYRFKEGIPSFAEALVLTHDENQTDAYIRQLQRELDEAFPAAQSFVRGIDQGPPVTAPLEVEIYGPNLEVLRELGEALRLRLEAISYVTHTSVSLIGGAPKLVYDLDEQKLRLAQLQLRDAADILNTNLLGAIGGEVLEGTERLPVRVRLDESAWGNAEHIADMHLPVALRDGTNMTSDQLSALPLRSVASMHLEPSRSPITRSLGKRQNIVQAYLQRGVLPEEALKLLRKDLEENPLALPRGYYYTFGGDADARSDVVDELMAPMGLILSALLATIVITFNSWRLSLVAVLVTLCSLGLSLLSLAIFRYPFGIQALIGVIGSIGVSINAAIIIITALQADTNACRGRLRAIRNVVMDSSRHIISTTVTTFGGFLPLILEGSQFWPPFAMAIAGGVLLSTIISFFLVPPLFMLATRLRHGSLKVLDMDAQETIPKARNEVMPS